jgi:TetR/AcrR family transcriptional repressor of mexJK operon
MSSTTAGGEATEGRSAQKRLAIMQAARQLFLRQGYTGTSMDEVAALAAVSKQTVYKQFADKESLLVAIVMDTVGGIVEPFRAEIRVLEGTDDLAGDLRVLARNYIAAVMQPTALDLRRLVIAEAHRVPALARTYYERAPERTIVALAGCFERLHARGLLRAPDPVTAAGHFAFLVLGRTLDRALFCGAESVGAAELTRQADAGVEAFLDAYGADPRR